MPWASGKPKPYILTRGWEKVTRLWEKVTLNQLGLKLNSSFSIYQNIVVRFFVVSVTVIFVFLIDSLIGG